MAATALMDVLDVSNEVERDRLDDELYEVESQTQIRVLTTDDTLDGGTVLPGFQLRLDRLFDPIAPPTERK